MAVACIQNISQFAFGFRFDAEYYQPEFLSFRKQLRNGIILNELLEDIRYGVQADPEYLESGIDYIRALNLNSPCIEGEILKIHSSQVPTADYRLKVGDILITRSGANCGDVGVITEAFEGATFGSYTIRLRCNKKISPFVLFAFLLSKYGRAQTFQIRYGSAQPNLSIPYIRNLITVPNFPDMLQIKMESLIRSAVDIAHSQKRLYNEAEAELLERMGWEKLAAQPVDLFYIEKYDGLQDHDRIDAEHFQPQYKRLREHLQKVGAKHISEFCPPPKRGVQPEFVDNGEVFVIDSKAVRPQGVEPSNERTNMTSYNQEGNTKGRVQKGDVLLNSTGRGTLGRAACYQIDKSALADNHVAIIRPDKHVCIPEYLSLFLNSPAGLAQSEMYQAGSSGQLELYPQHIMQFLIYLPKNKNGSIDLDWQKNLADKVISASKAKAEAQAKLEEAKRMVEKAISKR